MKSRNQLKSTNDSVFADNTTGLVKPTLFRDFNVDIIDSAPNSLDDQPSEIIGVKVTVSSADMLSLYSTPKTLIAAPGAGKMIDVLSMECFFDYGTVAYAGAGASQIWISYYSYGANLHTTAVPNLTGAADVYAKLPINYAASWDATIRVNSPLVIAAGTSNPTTGDGVLYVYLIYRITTL